MTLHDYLPYELAEAVLTNYPPQARKAALELENSDDATGRPLC